MEHEKISVIVPVYKVESYLDRCVQSIVNQTYDNFELILVDDGSPDNCGQMCDEYALTDGRIHVIHKENGGLSDARNVGLEWVLANSDSEWITFIDSDDWVHEDYLGVLYCAVKEKKCNISVCGYQTSLEEVTINRRCEKYVFEPEEFYVSKYINATVAWGKLYHRDCLRDMRYPVGKFHEDEFLTYKILFKEKKIVFIDQPLYFYFQNPVGITHMLWNEKKMVAYDAMEEQVEYFQANHYFAAARQSAGNYIVGVRTGLKRFKKEKPKNEKAIQLYKERNKMVPKYIKLLSVRNPKDESILIQVRPIRTRAYIYLRAVKNKLNLK